MSVTSTSEAPSTTWLFVSTSPDDVRTMPVPAAAPPTKSWVLTSTSPGSTRAATPDAAVPPPPEGGCDPPVPPAGGDELDGEFEARPARTPLRATTTTKAATAASHTPVLRGLSSGAGGHGVPSLGPHCQPEPPTEPG